MEEQPVDFKAVDKKHWHTVLIIVILLFLVLIMVRENYKILTKTHEKFKVFSSLETSNLPYTAGAGLRTQSVDSASDRGYSSIPYY